MKNALEGFNSRINDAEERISQLEDSEVEITAIKKNKEKRNEDSLKDIWDNVKCTKIYIIEFTEGEKREDGPEENI